MLVREGILEESSVLAVEVGAAVLPADYASPLVAPEPFVTAGHIVAQRVEVCHRDGDVGGRGVDGDRVGAGLCLPPSGLGDALHAVPELEQAEVGGLEHPGLLMAVIHIVCGIVAVVSAALTEGGEQYGGYGESVESHVLLSEEEGFECVGGDTGEIADECDPSELAHVPAEADLLEAHHDDACGRADDEHRAAHAGAVSEELPEETVDCKVACGGDGIHLHAAGHEGHVVDDRRHDADDAGDEVVVLIGNLVEPLAECGEHAGLLKGGHGQKDAEEEEDGGHVDAREQGGDLEVRVLAEHGVAVAAVFADHPQHAQSQQDAHEGGKAGEHAEDGHEDEAAHAEAEYEHAVVAVRACNLGLTLGSLEVALEVELHAQGGGDDRYERGEKELADDTPGRDHALDPEHDGGDVADGRERAAGVGGDDDDAAIYHAVLVVLDEFAEHHDHHDRGSEVVEDGREDECHECDAPQQLALAGGGESVLNEIESAVGIDDLDDGHGAHEEEQNLAGLAQMMQQPRRGVDAFGRAATGIEGPAHDTHQQCRNGFVDFKHAFEGYAQVAQDEKDDYCSYHCKKLKVIFHGSLPRERSPQPPPANFLQSSQLYLKQKNFK